MTRKSEPVHAYFVRYQKQDRPITDPEALPVGLRVTKAMYRKLQGELAGARGNAEFQTSKAWRMERLLQRAVKALTSPTENADAKLVIRDYMEELATGYRPSPVVVEQTSVTLAQWGDDVEVTDRTKLATKLLQKTWTREKAKTKRSRR